jgi:3-hydroxyisobutyrate dehydrogenase-like beta-hydroxyacid dehydrogenase
MINNYLLWAAVVADYEGLRLGQALGLELGPLREALRLSSGDNWALGSWDKGRPMPWAEKDMEILTETARGASLSVPLAEAVKPLIAALRATKEEWQLEDGVAAGGDEGSMSAFMRATDPRSIAHRAKG